MLVIVADDMGYADASCYGSPDISTPRIDSLATDGVRLTQAYVSGPVCAPTRAGLMTGRYQNRFGYVTYSGAIDRQMEFGTGVPTDEIMLPELMRRLGYRTSLVGKWHLGMNKEFHPNQRGVDSFFGFLSGGHDYYIWNEPPKGPQGGPILRNEEVAEGEGYLTEVFTREAVSIIEESGEEPFFLYLAYMNPHIPYEAPEEYRPPPSGNILRDKTHAMVNALDRGVGDVLDALDRTGKAEDTLVIFVNDNGSPHEAMNAPLSGRKGTLEEGGIRVAFLLRWPGHIPPGTVFDRPVIQLDILPTCVAAASGELPSDREYDGRDLLPFLRSERTDGPHERLFWSFNGQRALRDGPLKLFFDGKNGAALYDLEEDLGEHRDLAHQRPEEVERLTEELRAWEHRMATEMQVEGADGE